MENEKNGKGRRKSSRNENGDFSATSKRLEQHMRTNNNLECNLKCAVCQQLFNNGHIFKKHVLSHGVKLFTCESCGSSFKYLQSYMRHLKDYKGPHSFPCKKCGKIFKRLVFLSKHYCNVKNENMLEDENFDRLSASHEIPQIEDAKNEFSNDSSEDNLPIAVLQKDAAEFICNDFQCKECGWLFTSKSSLKCHEKVYAGDHFVYPCCGEALKWNKNILSHKCNIEEIKENIPLAIESDNSYEAASPTPNVESADSDEDKEEENRPYKCNNCPASFFRLSSLKLHIKKYPNKHDFECDKCKRCFPNEKILQKHLCMFAGGEEFKCSCLKYFKSVKKFKKHIGTSRPYFCCACNKRNESVNNLINHIRSHTKEKPYPCFSCNKSFSVKESLTLHLRKHDGIKPFKCSKCSYSTSIRWNLHLHERIHDPGKKRERTFLCTVCGASFYLQQHLRRHMKTHIKEKSHHCHLCGKLYSQSYYLNKHLESHKNELRCPQCHQEVDKKNLYSHHVLTGHLAYVCDPCQKVFHTKYNLERHLKRHSEPKAVPAEQFEGNSTQDKNNFTCDYCGRTFSRRGNLNQHLQTHRKSVMSGTGLSFEGSGQFDWRRHYHQLENVQHSSHSLNVEER